MVLPGCMASLADDFRRPATCHPVDDLLPTSLKSRDKALPHLAMPTTRSSCQPTSQRSPGRSSYSAKPGHCPIFFLRRISRYFLFFFSIVIWCFHLVFVCAICIDCFFDATPISAFAHGDSLLTSALRRLTSGLFWVRVILSVGRFELGDIPGQSASRKPQRRLANIGRVALRSHSVLVSLPHYCCNGYFELELLFST